MDEQRELDGEQIGTLRGEFAQLRDMEQEEIAMSAVRRDIANQLLEKGEGFRCTVLSGWECAPVWACVWP